MGDAGLTIDRGTDDGIGVIQIWVTGAICKKRLSENGCFLIDELPKVDESLILAQHDLVMVV